ncbi:unnamed protein product [Brassicogethes aeneus]|uniref:DEUBAD domain-containing protein n=1 Tax=Brassicogethes aeneus TaxID=1431903 RepID=A0A9P0FL04_BRAAE|nr:unnamed protein product [Brassicogethes aeneus]
MDSNSSDDSESEYSTDSSDDDGMETAQINGIKVQLPQALCERPDVFKEFFSPELWNQFSDNNKQHLQTFLPNFPENDDLEKSKTLQRLFDFKNFRFGNPLAKFHDDLKAGYFRPDIARMRKIINKAQKKEAKYRYKSYKDKLKSDVVESQKKLLNQIRNLPPGVEPRQEKRKLEVDYAPHRTKRRYFQVLSQIKAKVEDNNCSSDENYPEGPPSSLSRKQKRNLNSIRNSVTSTKEKLFLSTMSVKVNNGNSSNQVDLEKYVTPAYNPFYINEDAYKNLISRHKRKKLESPEEPNLNTRGISIADIVHRTQLPYIKNASPLPTKENNSKNRKRAKKPEVLFKSRNHFANSSESDSDSIDAVSTPKPKIKVNRTPKSQGKVAKAEVVKREPEVFPAPPPEVAKPAPPPMISLTAQYGKVTPAKIEDLEGIDMMNIPIDLDNSDIDILSEFTSKPELMQDTHSNFFSLIRDVICSTNEHRMNMYTLQERLKSWQENPISPLNDWYNLTDNWLGLLPSAITFLCGNSSDQPDDFVPYMEYKIQVDMYQWIGAGRDSDSLLHALCHFWLEHRTEAKSASPFKEKEDVEVELTERSGSPPPPRCATNWTVRKATVEEVKDFQEQERKRYEHPHKAFTFRCNGYESIVGPLKGIYNASVGNTKARGHTMLNNERPNFVTILSLVRDATARLPNGEGTRAEICELLKSSQYIAQNAADNVLQSVVSGALDRMHTQFDPCVKYDPKRKIWIYLHRNRSEEDFERIHQQYQGINKSKKSTKKSPAKPKPRVEKAVKTIKEPPLTPTEGKPKPVRRPAAQPKVVTSSSPPTLITVSPPKATSLLLSNNSTNNKETPQPDLEAKNKILAEQKEINDALQSIVQQPRTASPTLKSTAKSVVKILSPSQGKSLIIPTSNAQIIKQIQEATSSNKQVNQQLITQQLLQTLAAQQKSIIVQKQGDDKTTEQKIKVPVSVQQQIIQSISPQQLQNIKNVTLLRTSNQNVNLTPISGVSTNSESQSNIVTVSMPKQGGQVYSQGIQLKTQHQIVQALRHGKLLQQGVIPQPLVYKQKSVKTLSPVVTSSTTTVVQKSTSEAPVKSQVPNQGSVVAKVLTNAAGQVISVESLLAHQKQHGQLPQGTTLRVAGTKSGQQNIIHLSGTSKANSIAQFAVGSQNNLIAITTQPKLIVSSQTTTVTSSITSTKTVTRAVTKPQTVTKFTPKVTQQLINAKIITQNADGQKIVQPKIVMSQQGHVKLASGKSMPINKPLTLNVAGNSNTIRMVNAANLNLTHIGGKPVLLASKGGTLQNLQTQNVILQPNSSGASLVLQQGVKNTVQSGANNLNLLNQQNFVLGPQVKVQQPQVVLSTGGVKTVTSNAQQGVSQSHIVLGGQQVRLQTSSATSTQRLVLASQGQGGQIVAQQILLPAGFQGTAINLKALQGVKVIPIAQTQGKGIQGRQVFARVMNPGLVKTSQTSTQVQEKVVATSAEKSVPTSSEK